MNKVNLIGNLATDVTFSVHPKDNGKKTVVVASSILAVDRIPSRKHPDRKPSADFIPLAAFSQLAVTMADHLVKGARVGITGRLRPKRWTDKAGHRHFDLEVVVYKLDFLSPKKKPTSLEANPANG